MSSEMYRSWSTQQGLKPPLQIVDAEGAYFYDDKHRPHLDFSSQLMCSNLGHKNEAIISAICEQARKLPYVAPAFGCSMKNEATVALSRVMPQGLGNFFYSTSGTEANEAAIKIIRQYSASRGRYKILSRYRSYHGSTAGSISLTGDFRRWFAEPTDTIPGVVFVPDAYCYRCALGLSYPTCSLQCAEYVDYVIKEEGNVAGIFVEPVVGTNGVIVPPDGYFQRLRKIADENEVLLVADEVMSGWFRTGTAFAIDHWGVRPDILTTAKGCTAAYTPVGITVTTDEIHDYFAERYFGHGHTYAAHPLVLSAIPAAVSEYEKLVRSGLLGKTSAFLQTKLTALLDKHESIGDVRGLGHFWAIELVRDRHTKQPFNTKADKASLKPLFTAKLSAEMLKRGLYVASWYGHMIIAPPLIVTEEEIRKGVEIIDEVLTIADREIRTEPA